MPDRLVLTLVLDPLDDDVATKVAVIEAVAGAGMNVHAALVHERAAVPVRNGESAEPAFYVGGAPEEPEPGPELLARLLREAVHPSDRVLLPPSPHALPGEGL